MRESSGYGESLGVRLRANASAFVSRLLGNAIIAVTEIRADTPQYGPTSSLIHEDAFLAGVLLRDYPAHEFSENGRSAPVAALEAGDTVIWDIKRDPVVLINNPFHSIVFYFPRAALTAIADNVGASRIDQLHYEPGQGVDDPVMRSLAHSLIRAFEHPEQVSRLFVDHVTLAAGVHAAVTYGGMKNIQRSPSGGLAPWQEKRAKEMVTANLDGSVSLEALANACRLSVSQFSRAFRRSTGSPPHQWLLKRRIEAAKSSLRHQNASLADIARACGFADQSHFTRVFTRQVGISPGAWRREHGSNRWLSGTAPDRPPIVTDHKTSARYKASATVMD